MAVISGAEQGGLVDLPYAHVSSQPSKVFPSLFDHLDGKKRLTVLDVGPAQPETIDFFSQFKCRLHILDLYTEPLICEVPDAAAKKKMAKEKLAAKTLLQQFQDVLKFPSRTQFDICLFWDILNYMDAPALRAFGGALWPYIHPHTHAHAFGVHNVDTPLENCQYGVRRKEVLTMRPRFGKQLPVYPHPQAVLNEQLLNFDLERGVLLPDGKLEMLLRATV
jgi:hypothetical protein